MAEQSDFMLQPSHSSWLGGEPRVFVFDAEDGFPKGYPTIHDARLVDVTYQADGMTGLFDAIATAAMVESGSFQALLENLEELSSEQPLVVVVRGADRLLADAGPAVIHFVVGWESFTHHASGISAMYLVLETGPSATVNAAFYPGGVVRWHPAAK